MKRILSVLLAVVIIFFCLPLSAFAAGEIYQPAEDFQSVNCTDGYTYYPVDLTESPYPEDFEEIPSGRIVVNNTILGNVKEIKGEAYKSQYYLTFYITFHNGVTLQADYLREDFVSTYHSLLNSPADQLTVNFEFPSDENKLTADAALFKGERYVLSEEELEWCDFFYCYAKNEGPLKVNKGALLIVDNEFFFVDFSEIVRKEAGFFSPYDYENLAAFKITDPTLLTELKEAYNHYNYGDLAELGNKDLLELLYWILLTFLLGILPLVALIVCLIFALRPTTKHRKAFILAVVFLAIELIAFILFAVLTS